MTSSWFFLSTLNYDARSATHQITMHGQPQSDFIVVFSSISFAPKFECSRIRTHELFKFNAPASRELPLPPIILHGLADWLTHMTSLAWGFFSKYTIGSMTFIPQMASIFIMKCDSSVNN